MCGSQIESNAPVDSCSHQTANLLAVGKKSLLKSALFDFLELLKRFASSRKTAIFSLSKLKFPLKMQHDKLTPDFVFCTWIWTVLKTLTTRSGHDVGDQLLVTVARKLKTIVRQCDTVTRLGGNEFAVVLTGINQTNDAFNFAERIRKCVGEPFFIDDQPIMTLPSIGIAINNTEYAKPEEILRDADIAMYHAKKNQLGCAVFDRELRVLAINSIQLETDLHRSIELEQLVVHFQPIISLNEGNLVGFEALVRWQHPERGLIPPMEFIPLAESSGFIVPLTKWILREACLQLVR